MTVPVFEQPPPVPVTPRGPGVVPPFAAPPTEGRGQRIGVGLGIGGAALLLVCGGGIAAVVGLVTVATRAFREQVQVVVGGYYDDMKAGRYDDAYDAQCRLVKAQVTRDEFVREAGSRRVTAYAIGDLDLTAADLAVPVDVTYADGRSDRVAVTLGRDEETGRFQVCGVEE